MERCSNLNLAYTDFQYFTLFKPPKRTKSQAKRLPGTLNSLSCGLNLLLCGQGGDKWGKGACPTAWDCFNMHRYLLLLLIDCWESCSWQLVAGLRATLAAGNRGTCNVPHSCKLQSQQCAMHRFDYLFCLSCCACCLLPAFRNSTLDCCTMKIYERQKRKT